VGGLVGHLNVTRSKEKKETGRRDRTGRLSPYIAPENKNERCSKKVLRQGDLWIRGDNRKSSIV